MKKLFAAALMIPSIALAEFWTGNDLFNRLNSQDYTDRIQAMGYVIGVYDMGVHAAFCPPTEQGITVGQIADMTRQYLSNNPTQRHRAADRIMSDMFRQVWPCAHHKRGTRI